ncbi:hypothetical protein HPB50_006480 [Hyalomma asiaticum]|uniref:Uncharacterized protein n=1 Tax=Hyalomma asiaticum TaxID=266040 RepID=A0ACB7T1M7_HYAAI|nr:hypothetical protein HPB50_006480 [Hyalomma asiaticum]
MVHHGLLALVPLKLSGGPRNFKFRPRQPHPQNLNPEEIDVEHQSNREHLNPQRPNQSQIGPLLHRRPRTGVPPLHLGRNRMQDDQRRAEHHKHYVQRLQQQVQHNQQQAQHHQQQGALADGHPGHSSEVPHGGIAPPGVAQAQLQRTLQNMATAGLQLAPNRYVPHMGPSPTFMATPPLRPPPFPGANGQTPPHPDPVGGPSRHTIPSSWPPSIPPPHSQDTLPHFGNFLGARVPHNLPPHPPAMPIPPSQQQQQQQQHQQPFLSGPPSKPPFGAMPSQPVFPGALCADHPSQQWDPSSTHRGHEVESEPSQD